ncbi:MAG: Smr/MutS family protein [Bacteroidales bacterium]|nr:Smr/MutS family protein [Bacteroidales bacterium]
MADQMRDIKLEAKLGFDRVRKSIEDRCSTEYAADRVSREEFSSDPAEIRHRLVLTDEMRLILMFEESFPTSGYIDTLPFLRILAQEGSNIDLHSLGKLRTMTETSRKILAFFSSIKDGVYPALKRMTSKINVFPEVSRRIDAILDKTGNVKDTASDALYEIRRQIKDKEGAISKRMNSILKKAQTDGYVDSDAGIAVREGKMLLPVNSAFKRRVPGFVFDESSTGKTSFIQPAEIVELENEISELNFAQTREIARILSEFSDFLRPYVPELISSAECLGEIDFIMAKAQVALDYIAGMPVIADNGEMNLRKARHPLLEKALKREGKQIVPLTITLTPAKHILLISGPNAGGKSVCLKTTGLLQYMFQWGMLIPTSESSEMVVFDRIMVDIGDGQSIDNDLSTYSSFLDTMKEVLSTATDKTLVLIDELGSGTEPTAGGAIAEAILAELDRRGVYGVITTHYTNLKLYASGQGSGVVNGAMQFDAKNIVPLFKLDIGLPGNSFAFELARKMGLPEAIIKDAEQRAGEDFVGMERNLRKIVRNRRALDEKLEKIRNTDKTLENITGKYQKELEGIQQKKKEILDQARKEAEEIVKGANRQVENTIRTIKESQAEKEKTTEARKELQNFLGALAGAKLQEEKNKEDYLENKLKKLAQHKQKEKERKARRGGSKPDTSAPDLQDAPTEKQRTGPLSAGEKVRIKDNGMVGEVSLVSNKAVTVIVGNVSTKMPLSKVERISSNEYRSAIKEVRDSRPSTIVQDAALAERKLAFKPEIDVRGERVNDALEIVMKFIDDAIMLNMSSVRIVHGKGTGALRDEIQRFVKATPGVASVKDEHIQFGGTGVTIVTFE